MAGQQSIYKHSSEMYEIPSIYDLSCHGITIQQPIEVGSAHIVSVPAGAKIFIDYKGDIGLVTPTLIPNIPVGVHTYKLTYPGYIDVDGILFIEYNKIYELSIIMEISPGYFDPTKLIIFTLVAGVLIANIFQREKEDKDHRTEFWGLQRRT